MLVGQSDPRLILLSPRDNVMVVGRAIAAGESIQVSGAEVRAERDLPLGHKVACRVIEAGEKVMKYSAPIGSATRRIEIGEHVHIHNLKSDYTKTHVIDAAGNEEAR
jgi:altronate dehydratase